jgi:hypothetical protein
VKWHVIHRERCTATNASGIDFTVFRDRSGSGPWTLIVGGKFVGGFSSMTAAKRYASRYRKGLHARS